MLRSRGIISTYSFRDLTPVKSIRLNSGISDYLKAFKTGNDSIDGYIISTIGSTEPLLSPREMGSEADVEYFAGITLKDKLTKRRAILSTTKEDLIALSKLFDLMAQNGSSCIFGFKDQFSDTKEISLIEL